MKNLNVTIFLFVLFVVVSCTHKLQSQVNHSNSVIDIFKDASQKNKTKKAGKHSTSVYVYERRKEAVKLFSIETDTSKLNRFIVVDVGNLEGADYFGEIIINDSLKYNYSSPYFLTDTGVVVKKTTVSPFTTNRTRDFILNCLKAHRFTELEAFANEKGKTLSGSSFYSIGMYEKGMDSVYVKLIPAFIIN
jgi:hypothetical protein